MGKAEKISFRTEKNSAIKRILLISVVSLASAIVILIAGFSYIYYITPANAHGGSIVQSIRFMVNPGQIAFEGKENMLILCMGADNNYTDQGIMYTKNARSDTIFVVSLDSKGEKINLLSIPRDTWVELSPEHGFDKINAAYSYGGIPFSRKCIENFLGITIDHYLLIKVKEAENLVNALGGLEVDVEKDMDYDDTWGHLHIHLKKGPQLLNGQQAVGYSRFRHDEEGDWGRIRRQQQVINALIRDLKKPSNLMRIEKIVKIVHDSIETDLSITQLLDLARLYKDFDRSNLKSGMIKGEDGPSSEVSYIVPYEDEKKALVKRLLLRDTTLMPSEIRVGILNGSNKEGQATELADTLTKRGYKVMRVEDADKNDYNSSRVIDHINDQKTALSFNEFLGDAEYVVATDAYQPANEDITIIIGNDWQFWKNKIKETNALDRNHGDVGQERHVRDIPLPTDTATEEYPGGLNEEYIDPGLAPDSTDLSQEKANPVESTETPATEEPKKEHHTIAIPTPSLMLPADEGTGTEPPQGDTQPAPAPTKKSNVNFEYQ